MLSFFLTWEADIGGSVGLESPTFGACVKGVGMGMGVGTNDIVEEEPCAGGVLDDDLSA